MGADTCKHEWVATGITHIASGRTWQQGSECSYCPKCRNFALQRVLFLEGNFHKNAFAARRATLAADEAYRAEKRAWLQEHYPEHAATTEAHPAPQS